MVTIKYICLIVFNTKIKVRCNFQEIEKKKSFKLKHVQKLILMKKIDCKFALFIGKP